MACFGLLPIASVSLSLTTSEVAKVAGSRELATSVATSGSVVSNYNFKGVDDEEEKENINAIVPRNSRGGSSGGSSGGLTRGRSSGPSSGPFSNASKWLEPKRIDNFEALFAADVAAHTKNPKLTKSIYNRKYYRNRKARRLAERFSEETTTEAAAVTVQNGNMLMESINEATTKMESINEANGPASLFHIEPPSPTINEATTKRTAGQYDPRAEG